MERDHGSPTTSTCGCPWYAGASQTSGSLMASSSSAVAANPESSKPDSSAHQLQELQRQVAQAATAAGVLVEQIADDTVHLQLQVDCQAVLEKLKQLQQEAAPYAEKLKVMMLSEHALRLCIVFAVSYVSDDKACSAIQNLTIQMCREHVMCPCLVI